MGVANQMLVVGMQVPMGAFGLKAVRGEQYDALDKHDSRNTSPDGILSLH